MKSLGIPLFLLSSVLLVGGETILRQPREL